MYVVFSPSPLGEREGGGGVETAGIYKNLSCLSRLRVSELASFVVAFSPANYAPLRAGERDRSYICRGASGLSVE